MSKVKIENINERSTTILDYETNKEVEIGSAEARRLVQGIVEMRGRLPIMGYFTRNLAKNIRVIVRNTTYYALCKDLFVEKFLIYDNNIGVYNYIIGADDVNYKRAYSKHKGAGNFPYKLLGREYNAKNNIELFKSTCISNQIMTHSNKALVPFTFGLEFETSAGYVPEELCFKSGLIPLRDGSITGVEYASTVMNPQTNGFDLLKDQVELLKEYTVYDKECSLHMHFGGYPLDTKAIASLYFLMTNLQFTLSNLQIVPSLTFKTSRYKSTGKDYCKYLPEKNSFGEIYNFLSEGHINYLGSLTVEHPGDQRRDAKWNIHSRYFCMNLINMCFYEGPKTVEFRFLRPTYNYNKIVNWIFIFNAILKYAIKISETYKTEKEIKAHYAKIITTASLGDFDTIFRAVYSDPAVVTKLNQFIKDLSYISSTQSNIGDYFGQKELFDDELLTYNALI